MALTNKCPSCGAVNAGSLRFCTECGSNLRAVSRVADLKAAYDHLQGQAEQLLAHRTSVIREAEIDQRVRFRSYAVWLMAPSGVAMVLGLSIGTDNTLSGLTTMALGGVLLAAGIVIQVVVSRRRSAARNEVTQYIAGVDARCDELRRRMDGLCQDREDHMTSEEGISSCSVVEASLLYSPFSRSALVLALPQLRRQECRRHRLAARKPSPRLWKPR